jgi:hypothetical protein
MPKIRIVIGDPSGDGHGRSDSLTISSNLTRSQLFVAYQLGIEKLGFDITEEIRSGRTSVSKEDLTPDQVAKLRSNGYDPERLYLEDDGYVDIETFRHIYLFTCKLGNPSFEYTTKRETVETIEIDGYGFL